jgi:hypothetical protein
MLIIELSLTNIILNKLKTDNIIEIFSRNYKQKYSKNFTCINISGALIINIGKTIKIIFTNSKNFTKKIRFIYKTKFFKEIIDHNVDSYITIDHLITRINLIKIEI